MQLLIGREYGHHAVPFLEQDRVATGCGYERVIPKAIDRQFDFAKPDFKLATFTALQYRCTKMITDFEFKPGLVIDHQGRFSVDFGNINAFGGLLGDVDEARLELLDQFCPQITKYE